MSSSDTPDLPLFSKLLGEADVSSDETKKTRSPATKKTANSKSKARAGTAGPAQSPSLNFKLAGDGLLPAGTDGANLIPAPAGTAANLIPAPASTAANLISAHPHTAAVPERKTWTVTELTTKIRAILEPSFTNVWIQGEISNCRPAASGHAYFSLKDANSCISAAAFGWGARKKGHFELKDGLSVLCHGKVAIYPVRGTYQLIVDHIEPMGAGALTIAFEQLKAKLQGEGLFDPRRKRPLPAYPSRIAIVTSPSGAAIRDMLNILARRAPHVRVTIVPAIVQGEEAPRQIIRALELANRHELGDLVVLARGGGSIEDMWCFNDEKLARAIAASRLPVVSAVGHEIDFTISDFVSDLRAPTPSAAAELVTGHWVDAVRKVRESRERLQFAIVRDLTTRRTLLSHVSARVVNPRDRLREQAQRCDELFLRLERAFRVNLDKRRGLVNQWMGKLDALSPLRVLERGYSIVREAPRVPDDGTSRVVKSAGQVKPGQELRITFHDGETAVKAL